MNLSWFANILVHHPFVILSAVAVFSGTCIIIPFTLKSMSFPNFQDPQMGFSTRGTTISNRLTSWTNLIKSTRSSGHLAANPKEFLHYRSRNNSLPSYKPPKKNGKRKKTKSKPVYGNVYLNEERNSTETVTDVDRWKAVQSLTPGPNKNSNVKITDNFFCGSPEAMIFLPLACSTAILPYYHELEKIKLEYDGLKVVAMDFGIKSALFDECLIRDTWLMGTGALFCLCGYSSSGKLFSNDDLVPACMVIWERSCFSNGALFRSCLMVCFQRWCCFKPQWNLSTTWFQCSNLNKIWKAKEDCLLDVVIKLKYFWFLALITIAFVSGVIVVVYPKLQLPDTSEFQLFAASHPFEQYDFHYKSRFWFNEPERGMDQSNFKLPLRFVWGVLPIDNGDHLDPSNLGTLTLDPTFDMSKPESQEWLKDFCQNLRQQPFYQSTIGPLLPNCFVETFMKSMRRKCYDPINYKDHTPCCETSKFPFNRSVFNECIIDEMDEIYGTSANLLNSAVAGPKFSKDQLPTIKAVIVEYDSNYSYSMSYEQMHEFYTKVEGWMNGQLQTAPDSMKNGWFISDLEFYDLQRELNASTEIAVAMSMGLALIVLFLSTLNVLTSLYAIITITSSIFVTMAVLVLLGWKLNILESIAISTAIGLTADFSLHYSVNYRMCPESVAVNRETAARHALSYMAGPALMAAITTGAAGALMLPSLILPYIQIGVFLVIVMCISWIYATFLLGSLLAIAGPDKSCGQFKYSKLICCVIKSKRVRERPQMQPSTISDSHELESLTYIKKRPTDTQTVTTFLELWRSTFYPK
ncbi:hypothetical protein NQ314_020664 [Rhamnusium bicolor]|uniref:Protein dispatched n=1 Tax=Rhamnusium bicolor TaxID=1586634 RepID=A0AAV8WM89_9CUCU|nr:hypothetical protein NQ314_020664 [Rhamnusium bicolor]